MASAAPESKPRATVRFYEPRDRDALFGLQERRKQKWREQGADMGVANPDDPTWTCRVVIVDENDVPIGAIGARRVAELGSTVDPKALPMHDWFELLPRAWAKLAVALYRQGYDEVFCRVASPTPAWENTLVKRARFYHDDVPHFYLDLEAALEPKAHE